MNKNILGIAKTSKFSDNQWVGMMRVPGQGNKKISFISNLPVSVDDIIVCKEVFTNENFGFVLQVKGPGSIEKISVVAKIHWQEEEIQYIEAKGFDYPGFSMKVEVNKLKIAADNKYRPFPLISRNIDGYWADPWPITSNWLAEIYFANRESIMECSGLRKRIGIVEILQAPEEIWTFVPASIRG